MIKIQQLSLIYPNGIEALKNIDLIIDKGGRYAFYGPSGSGKTTLLKCIAGLLMPYKGKIEYSHTNKDYKISMVFQRDSLFDEVSAYENIRFGIPFEKNADETRKILEISQLCGCDKYLNQKAATLSGGQRQRIAIARALVSSPDLLLMDEPFTNLNPKLKSELIFNINSLQKKLGFTLIYVSHDINETRDIADTIVFMYEGKIVQQGTYYELKYFPKTLMAAKYFLYPGMNIHKTKEGFTGFLPEAKVNRYKNSQRDLEIRIDSLNWIQYIAGKLYSCYESSFGKIVLQKENLNQYAIYIDEKDLYFFDAKGISMKKGS